MTQAEEIASKVITGIIGASALILALYQLITHWQKLKGWWKKRRARTETLDRLLNNAESFTCESNVRSDHTQKLTALSDKIDDVSVTLAETINHNKRQDKEISRSNEQRELILPSLFALIDVAHKQGHNGPVTKARTELEQYLLKQANKPFDTERKEMK